MTEVIKVEDCGENIGDYDVPIYKAIIIPKGATNGDVIKAMFPKVFTKSCRLVDGVGYFNFKEDEWWNAPYQREENK